MKTGVAIILVIFTLGLLLPMTGCQSTDVGGLARPLDVSQEPEKPQTD